MQQFETVAIVGVGLIGASIGLALKGRRLCREVVGIGRRSSTLRKAQRRGAVDRTTVGLAKGVAKAEVVVVCTPVESIADLVLQAAGDAPQDALILDAGSTKAAIVSAVERALPKSARFVGSHPMAGSEMAGPEHAQADLFDGRPAVLTPTRKTPAKDVRAAREFWAALGADVVELSPQQHDQGIAAVSHLPHLLASAIAGSTPEGYFPLVSTGWLSTTRIAGSDPELWRQILIDNRANVLASLDRTERMIDSLRAALERGDGKRLKQLLTQAQRIRDALGS